MLQKIVSMSGNTSEYYIHLEQYVNNFYTKANWGNYKLTKECLAILEDAQKKFLNNEFDITKINAKERFLLYALRLNQFELAEHIISTLNLDKTLKLWLAVTYNCYPLLTKLLQDTSDIDFTKKNVSHYFRNEHVPLEALTDKKNDENILHEACDCELKTIQLLTEGLGYERIKQLVNEPTNQGYTPMHYIAISDSEFDDAVKIFLEMGADLKAKTLKGEYPTQLSWKVISPFREALYRQHGMTHLKTLDNAIYTNDVGSAALNLPEATPKMLRGIFFPNFDYSNLRKIPAYKAKANSVLEYSMALTYYHHAIYCNYDAIVKFVTEEILIKQNCFSIDEREKLLKDALSFLADLIQHKPQLKANYEEMKTYFSNVYKKISAESHDKSALVLGMADSVHCDGFELKR